MEFQKKKLIKKKSEIKVKLKKIEIAKIHIEVAFMRSPFAAI